MKFSEIRFAVVGGDFRQVKLINILARKKYAVNIFGIKDVNFEKNVIISNDLLEAISNADIIIGPIPCSHDNKTLFSKYYDSPILLEDLFKNFSKDKLFISGKITFEIKKIINHYGLKVIDLLEKDELAVLNAIPTAEGAIQCAMENSEITIHGSQCLVLGFGKCGKVLAHKLKGIDANLTVEARKSEDLAYIKSYGYNAIHLHDLKNSIKDYDFIFNTIPSLILDSKLLGKIKKNALIIDLASKPGGVDYNIAKEQNINFISALGLPGKVAPESAALIIYDTIFNVISEIGGIV